MQVVDTVIVQDCWWNGSARMADIVLPATTTMERNDISSGGTYSIDKVFAMRQVVAPVGDVLDDFEIFRRLSVLCGVEYARGIKDGDLVELYNERGSLVVGARVSDKIMPGVVSIYEGAWPQLDSKGRCNNGMVNFLTSSRPTSGLSQAPTANTCLASLRKCTDADPGGTKAFEPPKIGVKQDLKFDEKFFGLDRAQVLREKATASMTPGEKIFYQRCTVCHGPRDPGGFNKNQWLGITQSMFPRAGLNDKEQKLVRDFLLKNAKPS